MTPDISVVIPVYNEAASLEPLQREIAGALDRLGRPYEVIYIDDGSTDDSFARLRTIHERDERVRVIQFRRNFGQTAAFAAGFAAARGSVVVTADADGQNDPADIPALLARLDDTADVVCGWRRERKDPWLSRRLPSSIANRLISWTTGVRLRDYGCSLKAFRADVVKPLRLYGELHRFLPALAREQGARIVEVPVNHRPRVHGRSKYGLSRIVRVALDLVTVKFLMSYSTRPLQIFGLLGLALGLAGGVTLAFLAYAKFGRGEDIGTRPLLTIGVLSVMTGVQLITLGLLAELQARTYHESQGKAIYSVRQTLERGAVASRGAVATGGVGGHS